MRCWPERLSSSALAAAANSLIERQVDLPDLSSIHPPATFARGGPLLRSSNRALFRILSLAGLFIGEALILSVWLDNDSLLQAAGLAGFIGHWGPWILKATVGFAAIFASFAYLGDPLVFDAMDQRLSETPPRWPLIAGHAAAIAFFGWVSAILYGSGGRSAGALAGAWLAAGIAAVVLAAFAALPAKLWLQLVRRTGSLWLWAALGSVAGCIAANLSRSLWEPAARITFLLVRSLLAPLVSGVVTDPSRLMIGTSRFRVLIAPQCSGLEGAGLIVIFSVLALTLFRRECRFPQALLLIPAGAIAVLLLNAVRLTALVLIGNAGARDIALGGFHSQAGWILFNGVAVGLCVSVRRIPWIATDAVEMSQAVESAGNGTAAYLTPFLAILIAGMIATAASGGFEWLYPLRVLAAFAAVLAFQRAYHGLDWSFDGVAVLLGAAVFAMWIGADRLLSPHPSAGMPPALAHAAAGLRFSWIAVRIVGAVVTVPVAEELAFRGYLMRRFAGADFETVAFQRSGWLALALSSAIFGAMHGTRWPVGILAGLVFGWAAMRRGRIGDAIAAHSTANLLLAAYVLWSQQWSLW